MNLNENFNLKDLFYSIEHKIYPEFFQKKINSIDTSYTYKLFTIATAKYIIEIYELSINILLNTKKLYKDENKNTELSQTWNKDLNKEKK